MLRNLSLTWWVTLKTLLIGSSKLFALEFRKQVGTQLRTIVKQKKKQQKNKKEINNKKLDL